MMKRVRQEGRRREEGDVPEGRPQEREEKERNIPKKRKKKKVENLRTYSWF